MSVVIGIDVGGSTTKIVGFNKDGALIEPLMVRATDPVTSIYGGFGRFTSENGLRLNEIGRVAVTGVGSSYVSEPIYGLDCETAPEFNSVGRGGLYLSGLDEAIVVSMGTGTAFIHAKRGGEIRHLGGTGVGGGTLMGLAKKMLEMEDIDNIVALAEMGDLDRVDLRIHDITKGDVMPGMPADLTAANFGKLSDLARKEDLALGIINMIFETAGMMALFAARSNGLRDIVVTGNMTSISVAKRVFDMLSKVYGVNYIIPENSQFATAVGAALGALDKINA
ncbi:MAG: type II pantothenate kinase [Clostridia bacterium]|nr:type II pantothenate kinase [Clostridia bacterium]